jgi:membrane-bound lytic murein transglycosylase F
MPRTIPCLLLLLLASALPASPAPTLRVLNTVLASPDPVPGDAVFFYRDGEPGGLEYEILQYFAKAQGLQLEVVQKKDIPAVLDALARGEGDVVAASLRLTPERRARFAVTPHFPVRVVLVERKEHHTTDISSLAGQTMAAVRGAAHEQLLREQVRDVKFVYRDTIFELMELVATGKARAMAAASTLVLPNLKLFDSLHATASLTTGESIGFLTRKGSPLAAQLDEHVRVLKGSGIYYRMVEKYFGTEAVAIVKAGRVE